MKTTKADFEYFKERCQHWIQYLSMADWSVHYSHKELENNYAETYWQTSSGVATVALSTYWDDLRPKTQPEIDRLALHEVLHLVMAPLVSEATYRYATEEAIRATEHRIIRQLEKLVRT